MNECNNLDILMTFRHCICYIQTFKLVNLKKKKKKSHFPIDVNGDVAQKLPKILSQF